MHYIGGDAVAGEERGARPAEVNEAADHHVIAGLDESAGADVCQGRILNWVKIVDFNNGNPGGTIRAANAMERQMKATRIRRAEPAGAASASAAPPAAP